MLQVLIKPSTPIITLAEAKRHLGVTSDERDTDIESMIDAATSYIARRCGRTFGTTLYRLSLDEDQVEDGSFTKIELPYPPVQSVALIEYEDANGTTTELLDYQLVSTDECAYVLPAAGERWPAVQDENATAFRVEYLAGYSEVPAEAKHAVKVLIRHWYDNASAVLTGTISKEIELSLASLCRSLGTGWYADV